MNYISYGAFLHLIRYPQVIAIFTDDCIGLVFFWIKISALALQTYDGMEYLFFQCLVCSGPVLLVLGLVIPLCLCFDQIFQQILGQNG